MGCPLVHARAKCDLNKEDYCEPSFAVKTYFMQAWLIFNPSLLVISNDYSVVLYSIPFVDS